MRTVPDNFLWGGAIAAHQIEGGWDKGGKGVSIADVLTAGAHGVDRRLRIFMGNTRKISSFWRRWDSGVCAPPSRGREFFRRATKRSLMRRGLCSMTIFLANS